MYPYYRQYIKSVLSLLNSFIHGRRNMSKVEKRSFERIPNSDLPNTFKSLLIDIGKRKNLNAETVDVSTTGVGVTLSLSPKLLKEEDRIVLHSSDHRYEFLGQIVNVQKLRKDLYRLGVVLKYS